MLWKHLLELELELEPLLPPLPPLPPPPLQPRTTTDPTPKSTQLPLACERCQINRRKKAERTGKVALWGVPVQSGVVYCMLVAVLPVQVRVIEVLLDVVTQLA